MNDTKLWALHILGPDDVYAAPSEEEATACAKQINDLLSARVNQNTNYPPIDALVILWPFSAEAHAADLPKWKERTATANSSPPGDKDLGI